MPRSSKTGAEAQRPRKRARALAVLVAGITSVAIAALAGLAVAKSFALKVAKHAKVVNMITNVTKHENIVTTRHGFAVYTLSGDSRTHPECTSSLCLSIWPAVKAPSGSNLSKAPGIKGKLGTWPHDGFVQLTLRGHPLYKFFQDTPNHVAHGEGITSFGGTWHVVRPKGGQAAAQTNGGNVPTYPGH